MRSMKAKYGQLEQKRQAILFWIVLGILVLTYVLHFAAVCIHAVDLPFYDEWQFLASEKSLSIEGPLSWEKLLFRAGEHYLVPTRLQVWLLYQLNGWNLISQQMMNFLLFGVLLASIVWIARRLDPEVPLWATLAFVIFLLSPLGHQNHSWGYQSQFHFALLTFPLAVVALFSEAQRSTTLGLGVACAWLAVYSQAAGLVGCLSAFVCYLFFKGLRVRAALAGPERRRELIQGLAVLLTLGAGIGLWFVNLSRPPPLPEFIWPWSWTFWRFFVNEVSFGFGYSTFSTAWGFVCLLLVVTPVAGQLLRCRGRAAASFWALTAILLGVLAILASIAVGRAGFEPTLHRAKVSRYFHVAVLLLPFAFLAWRAFLVERPRLRVGVALTLWLVCALGSWDDVSLDIYQRTAERRRGFEAKVREYYYRGGTASIPSLSPWPSIARNLDIAKRAQVSFARRLSPPASIPPPQHPGNDLPIGSLNSIGSDGMAVGWALDPDTPSQTIAVRFFVDEPAEGPGRYAGSVMADRPRPDVNQATGYPGNHGFLFSIPPERQSGQHRLYVYGVDLQGKISLPLKGSGIAIPVRSDPGKLKPIGFLNSIDESNGTAAGWALDPTEPSLTITVHFYVDGPSGGGGQFVGWSWAVNRSRPGRTIARLSLCIQVQAVW